MQNTKKIVVTGGTGFIGSHLIQLLLQENYSVCCLVRKSSNIHYLPKEVEIRSVNLMTGEGLESALAGSDMCIHLAALLFGCNWKAYLEANSAVAQNLCNALANLGSDGPKKCILISSMAATGPSSSSTPVTDRTPAHPVSAYGWSKLLVERTFLSMYKGNLVILRPSIVYGSNDKGLLPVFQGAKLGFCVSPGYGRAFPISCIHGKDMAKAILCAMQDAAHGIYHVSDGKFYTMDVFCQAMAQALQKNVTIFHMPLPILTLTAAIATFAGAIAQKIAPKTFPKAPNWNLDKLYEARQDGWLCDSSRLFSELGFTPAYSLEEGMKESVEGYQKRGLL